MRSLPPSLQRSKTQLADYMPAADGGFDSPELVRRRARQSRDDYWYDKTYAMQQVMAGDLSVIDQMGQRGSGSFMADPDLGDYPDIDPELGPYGIQNHLLVDSRINVQGIVYNDPEFVFEHPSPLARQVNNAYFRLRWKQGDWSTEFYQTGMDVQVGGIGFIELGFLDGALTLAHRPILDMMWDPLYRSPSQWRYVFCRQRLDVDTAIQKYGHLYTPDEICAMAVPVKGSNWTFTSRQDSMRVVHEWSYWSKDSHCVYIGGISKSDPLYLDEQNRYQRGMVGPNPHGEIPFVAWIESWAPGMRRPVGRVETSWRQATMLMLYDAYYREILLKGVPMNFLSTIGLQPDQIEEIKRSAKRGLSNLEKIITVDGVADVRTIFHRTAAAEIPQSLAMAREIQKNELNASSGVMDTQRGQPLPGEKTALEVRTLSDSQGVQARHTRKQFARFLELVVFKGRKMSALYDRQPCILQLADSQYDTQRLPLAPMLSEPMAVVVEENSLTYLSEQDIEQRRLVEFQSIDMIGIQLGVNDPYKTVASVYADLGKRDPTSRMFTPEEYQQRQQMAALAAMSQEQQPGQAGKPAAKKEKPKNQ